MTKDPIRLSTFTRRNTFLDRYKHSHWPWIVVIALCIVGIVVMGNV